MPWVWTCTSSKWGTGFDASKLPVGQQFRFGLGAECQASPKLNVAFSYELAYGGSSSLPEPARREESDRPLVYLTRFT
jgi:hypothetical protein